MIRALAVLFFTLLSSGLSSAAFAQQPAGRAVCAPTNAVKVRIEQIVGDPAAWFGRCVSVKGIYASERVYADADAIYGLNPNSIGGYVDGKGSMLGFWTGEFTGRVADCRQAENDLLTGLLRSPGISLHERTLGCVKPEGPFLVFMTQGELEPVKLTRRTGKPADLTPAARDWPHLATVEKRAADFLAAVQAKDAPTLRTFIKNAYRADQLLADTAGAIADIAQPSQRPSQVFVHTDTPDAFASEVCTCRAKSCTNLWPIARRDADNQPTRPYACVRVDGSRGEGGWTYEVDGLMDYDGLPERRAYIP